MKKISYNHPNFRKIKDEVSERFERDFNYIQLDVIRAVMNNYEFENIACPSFSIIADEYMSNYGNEEELKEEYTQDEGINISEIESAEFYEWLEQNKYNEIMDNYHESENYPMWNILFEARDSWLSEWIENHVDELYNIGIGVMLGDNDGNLSNMLFIAGCGYDFYEAHWIPLYTQLLNRVKIEEKIDEDIHA